MAHEEATRFIERLLPGLRKRHVRYDSDEDICQHTLFDMLKKWDTLEITTDAKFANVFSRFYHTLKWVERAHRARSLSRGTYWLTHAGGIPEYNFSSYRDSAGEWESPQPRLIIGDHNLKACDPWETARTEALEFIELLPTPLYRKSFYLYFIEGYTQSEAAVMVGTTRELFIEIIREGITFLKAKQQVANLEGRNVCGAPTLIGDK